MPISIDPKQDTLPIPAKLYKTFMGELTKTYTNKKLKDDVKIDDAKIQGIVDALKDLNNHASNLKDDASPVLFHLDWNKTFKDKDSAKKLFDFIKDKEIKDLDTKARAELQGTKRLAANLATAAKAAVDEGDGILKAYAALNNAVAAASPTQTPAAQPAATPTTQPAASTSQQSTTPATQTAQTIKESVVNSLKLNKKLYELGLIERNEYLASIVKTKNILEEQSTPSPTNPAQAPASQPAAATQQPSTPAAPAPGQAPTGAADTAKARQEFETLIANFGSPTVDTKFKAYMTNMTMLQDSATKSSQQQINETKRKLVKNLIKKRILSEAKNKEYLNEFLSLLLGAALVALGAWIGKKFSQYFTQGPATTRKPDTRHLETDADPDNKDFEEMMQNEYTDPSTGQNVNQQGQRIDPEIKKKTLQAYVTTINEIVALHEQNLKELTAKLPACNYDATNKPIIEKAINDIPKTIDKGKAVIPALEAYIKG